ncbi:MAG: PAS domain-containing sensor histidine kinase, partial [Candidatus Aquicultor sp.]
NVYQNKKHKKDNTQQKLAEAKLKESEEKFRSLSDESPNMIFINNAGRVIYVNKKCGEVLGYSREEFLDAKFNFLDLIAPEYVDTVKKNFADRYSGIAKDSYEYALVTKDKKRIETSISSKIITYEGNKVILGIVTDLTERKCSELVITKQNKQLKELNATKDKFFSIIAHDLRSPLQGFLGMTQLMSEEVGEFSPAELSKFAGEMNTSAQNLFKLLQNLLDWARLQNGTIDFTPGECSLKEIVDQNIETIAQRGAQKGITILNEIAEEQTIYADEKMINTVFRNLLSNAVKFTRKDDRITINSQPTTGAMVMITVKDTGVGISGENLSKLFKLDEKVRTKGTEGEPSTGLGLLLCKEFVEKNGGEIWAESEEEKGSTFYFTLPAKNEETL